MSKPSGILPETDFYDIPQPNFITSNYQDYHGHEDYYAFYLMPEINVTSKFTFVPGVRYEANRTEYTGYRGNRLGILRDFRPTPIDTVAKIRENEFVLPMVQAVYRPTEWLNFKAGYTHTLQRPNYNNIMPGWVINTQGSIDNLSNFRLEPELSRNWDVQMSVYSDKIGLFTLGAFHKRIKDMIFWTGQTVITDTLFFELPSLMHRQRAAYAVNNPHDAFNYGYEIEWQSNFWYLPGLLNGLVMNVNYTRNESEAKYLRSEVKTVINPVTYQSRLISEDTTYTNPMLGQPDHLLNLTLGYDYKGFSIRGAMRYKSRIFTSNSWYEKLRGYSTDFYRYDLMLRQQLPVDGLEFFLNVNNLTGERERSVINHMNYTSYLEDYGRSANLGFRYRL
ncbi:MAG: TonB-dependent receptor [candidate division KSB1 bacterium]|nr:TonB-dependent receptor [candidate division KSB1 bacterium]